MHKPIQKPAKCKFTLVVIETTTELYTALLSLTDAGLLLTIILLY